MSQSMTEKDLYLSLKQQEDATTLKVLHAYPADMIAFKTHPSAQSAGQVAWTLALGNMVLEHIIKGDLTPSGFPEMPATWQALIDAFERARGEATTKLGALTDDDFNAMVRMPVGPKQMGEKRRGAALWYFLHDGIHHRGQLSVYLRAVGAKVPSIYGPSGDEPWF